jgi:putative methyltransferase
VRSKAETLSAAPGNKTSYMSALAPAASITAFERDAKRYQTLETMLRKGECRNVKAIQGDFLESDPTGSEWKTVTRMYVCRLVWTEGRA